MINMSLNGIDVSVEKGTTLLEAARFYGIEIPTLCYNEGLSPYGACRLCLVEIGPPERSRLVSSCTYRAREGLIVRTGTKRVLKSIRLLIELYLATCPSSKVIQDLASKYHVTSVRFHQKHEDCILCGLCVRMCDEQMQANAIGFVHRGGNRLVGTPYNKKSDDCRYCGACMYICPACQARCQGPQEESGVCNACLNLSPPCLDNFDAMMCYMDPCVACEQGIDRKPKK
ncbi:2Fe-2S iron-sulfur cluster-binding protein [Candidatus Contubernalis alkaliaceticus]|uniref:2Fe-2S iron-sulfur cluster-binding protein n=1 Tax=Candidatus Contubernalis alkaliaceticus TaxID=338645 RepID=UPI001F4BE842|nr:2Fe-2S iron-sulfur cluster-binding protein [Candidatus Contubernalis alkalaceticus]UNC93118.1 (2Fe-2S)-binding protein [Candidatus Contubernalis alkalaceticus]